MIRSSSWFAALTCLGALTAGSALAQAAQPSFESLDTNHDGKISLTEAAENDALFVAFKGLDADKDGNLTREEFAKYK